MTGKLLRKRTNNEGSLIQNITPETAGWSHVSFQVYRIQEGDRLELVDAHNEQCLVLISGKVSAEINDITPVEIGKRMSPFEKIPPCSIYVTNGDNVGITALTDAEVAVCKAPGKGSYPSRLIGPKDVGVEFRGQGNNQRLVHNILPDCADADSLLVVEVFTNEGCTSSYPSHKHDTAVVGKETQLEETYYHRLNPTQGFCFQRVYTDSRDLDESMAVYDGDVVLVPRGYHPVATIAGYDSYYLNVMAGPHRKWLFSWEEDHAWINTEKYVHKLTDK
ncbi:5-deoxy-glucuronate isomerase [Vibrio thalassae]|uniref:5-deoxy-glucuronate isomerase n=1 Tax=Vibrio thalassae TaxID=1243014 RepID=A0A240ELK8_9VIBR|nr:5-deoxy-glucuronate isomerase [Vibrio thalassae]SNX49496.1 5-deoxy-glucuronate isomerase [Vibrio thalassae]